MSVPTVDTKVQCSIKFPEDNDPILFTGNFNPGITNFSLIYLTLASGTAYQSVQFPTGLIVAKFIYVLAVDTIDLKATRVYAAAGDQIIPPACAIMIFDATALWLSSVSGGTLKVVIAG